MGAYRWNSCLAERVATSPDDTRASLPYSGLPLFTLHGSKPTPRLGLHLGDRVAAVPIFQGLFQQTLRAALCGVSALFSDRSAFPTKPSPGGFFVFIPHCLVHPPLSGLLKKLHPRGFAFVVAEQAIACPGSLPVPTESIQNAGDV